MSIKVKIDNVEVEFDAQEQQPLLHQGRTYVPVRALFEHMGYNVGWTPGEGSNPKGTVNIWNGKYTIAIKEDSYYYTVNGTEYSHTDNLKAMIVGGRMMMPIRGVLQQIGCSVNWDEDTETVIVETNNEEETTVFKPLANTTYKIAAMAGVATGTEQTVKYLSLNYPIENNANVYVNDTATPNLWQVAYTNGDIAKIISCSNNNFALNYYSSTLGNPGICTVYYHSNNPNAMVEFSNLGNSSSTLFCTIKVAREGIDFYLTADDSSNDSTVSWKPYDGSINQIWQFIESSGLRKTIDLPENRIYNWNQHYSEISAITGNVGCLWTCGLDVANIYGPEQYLPQSMANAWGPYGYTWDLPSGCTGGFLNWGEENLSDSILLSDIRSEINNNRPVIIKLTNALLTDYPDHYVVAYGYKGEGTQKSDILVLDPGIPWNSDDNKFGTDCTLEDAETNNGGVISTGERVIKPMVQLRFTSER